MKQLFAAGQSAEPSVRAASSGVLPDAVRTALGAAAYSPTPEGKRPVRLSLLNTPGAGRVLTHITPRADGYFAHSLLDIPATADAQSAIQTWGSPQWQRHDPDSGGDLPEMPYLPVADILDDDSLQSWLATTAHRELLEFTLTALLGTPADVRIAVAATDTDAARVVYAVTRVLPPDLLDAFTFSTYESNPVASTARFTAADPHGGLPDACFHEPFVGFDSASGRKSDILFQVPFAEFAVTSLAEGEYARLDEVKAAWVRLGLKDPRKFDLVFRLSRGTGVMDKEEAAEALQVPAIAAWVAARSDAMNQFLDWALDDRHFANHSFSRAVQSLRQKSDVVGKLAQTVREEGLKALTAGNIERTSTALEVILPMAAPAKANGIWGELIGQLTNPDELPWIVRWYLLPRFVRFKTQQNPGVVDPSLAPWIAVPPDRLGELLALDLPRHYQLAAARSTLARPDEPSAALARALAANPKLTLGVLAPVTTETAEADRTARLFDTLLAEAPTHPWFEDALNNALTFPADLLNRFFDASLAAGRVDPEVVVRGQGEQLLKHFAGQPGLDRLGKQFLATPPADVLHHIGLQDFLTKLGADSSISAELRTRIEAVQAIRAYLDKPSFDRAAMTAASDGLGQSPPVVPAAAKKEVFDTVVRELLRRSEDDTLLRDLESALVCFGSTLANDPADLCENLLRAVRERTDLGRSERLSHAFLAASLGATTDPALTGKLDGLDGHAFAVAADAAKRGGNRLLDALDKRSAEWPKDAKVKWSFLLAAVRPDGAGRVVRDFLFLVLGALAATAGWWAWKLLR